jgi:hypothetical protein
MNKFIKTILNPFSTWPISTALLKELEVLKKIKNKKDE